MYPTGPDYVAAFFGCLYAGVVAVPAYPPRRNQGMDRLEAIAGDSGAKIALTNTAVFSIAAPRIGDSPALSAMQWIATDELPDDGQPDWTLACVDPQSIAFLQYTSGSTSIPKGVMLTHANIMHNEKLISEGCGLTEADIGVGWLPLYHDMGLIGNLLQPMYTGMSIVLMAPVTFLQRPLRWLQTMTRYRATASGGPNFAYELCLQRVTPEQRDELDLSAWSVACCGSEPVRSGTLQRFAEYFGSCGFRPETFFPCYGLAEASLYVSGGQRGDGFVIRSFSRSDMESNRAVPIACSDVEDADVLTLVSSGRSPADQRVVIADPADGTALPANEVGEIWVSGPSIAAGYWNRAEATQDIFGARVVGHENRRFLRTGDLGFLDTDNELFVTGRIKDLIIIAGRNHYPQDIETTVEQCHPALQTSGCAAFELQHDDGTKLGIVAEVERTAMRGMDGEAVVQSIRAALSSSHELQVWSITLIRPNTLPKTSSGKVRRGSTRTALLEAKLDVLYQAKVRAAPSRELA
jgi:acyl-CoA synthetase (AMP-forming)/AMP-acid ligase II